MIVHGFSAGAGRWGNVVPVHKGTWRRVWELVHRWLVRPRYMIFGAGPECDAEPMSEVMVYRGDVYLRREPDGWHMELRGPSATFKARLD